MLAIDNLKKHFGFVKAVDNVNLDIARGRLSQLLARMGPEKRLSLT